MFPARAGMSRTRTSGGRDTPNVPRASGDEPEITGFEITIEACSPRERG